MLLGVLLYYKFGNSLKSGAKANSNTPLFNDYKKHIAKLKMTVKFINSYVTKLFQNGRKLNKMSKKSFLLIPNRFLKHREPNLKCLEKLKIISALFKEFGYQLQIICTNASFYPKQNLQMIYPKSNIFISKKFREKPTCSNQKTPTEIKS